MAPEGRSLAIPATADAPALPSVPLEILRGEAVDADRRATSENTAEAYRSDWQSWLAFCERHGLTPLPAEPEHVRLYIVQLTSFGGRQAQPLRPRTAERHLAAIAAAHRAKNLHFDRRHPAIAKALAGIKRKFGTRQHGAKALRTADIRQICSFLGLDARSVRDRAIILLGFAGGFRRSELAALDVPDLELREEGLAVEVKAGKTDQEGKGRRVGILRGSNPETCPVAAVEAWMRAALIEDETGPLFVQVNRWGVIESFQGRISDKAVDRAVKAACTAAGLEGDYSAHSLRVGHVTEAKANKADRAKVKAQTGHASDQMLDRYDREADLFAPGNSSGLLGL